MPMSAPPAAPRAPGYPLVAFDFDGTLADSAAWLHGAINRMAARHGFRAVDPGDFEALRGQDNRAIVRWLGVPMWKLPRIAREMRAAMAADADAIRLFPGVAAMLRDLHDGGVRIAVVSSNAEANVRRILGDACAARVAHWACGASLFGKRALMRRVAAAAGVAPGQVLCVGDEARDIEAAHAEGMVAGAVTWGVATAELLRSLRPRHVFDQVGQIAPVAIGGRRPPGAGGGGSASCTPPQVPDSRTGGSP